MSADQHIEAQHANVVAGEGQHVLDIVGAQRSEIEVGMLQMQILWLLGKRSSHGYELMKKLNAIKHTKVNQGTLYPAMQRLMALGFVAQRESERRKVYSMTPKGRRVMASACRDFVATFGGIFEEFVCMKCEGSELVFIGREKK